MCEKMDDEDLIIVFALMQMVLLSLIQTYHVLKTRNGRRLVTLYFIYFFYLFVSFYMKTMIYLAIEH